MLKKTYSDTGQACQVTFELPSEVAAQTACLCGEFNGWDPSAHPMERQAEQLLIVTVPLAVVGAYFAGQVPPLILSLVLYTVPGVVIGGQLGPALATRLDSHKMERLLALIFILIGVITLWTTLTGRLG